MKRANHLIDLVADMDNLRLAFWKARKGKTMSNQVKIYREELDVNLLQLRDQILSGNVKVGQYSYFKIYDPKERQICAAAFSEQVLHHAVMNVSHYFFERKQIADSYACRKGKGTYAALNRAKIFARKYRYFLKLDVRKFFDSIAHYRLKKQLDDLFKDCRLLSIFYNIIDSYEVVEGRGVPIGNLTSQYFANHYLCELDHFIKEKLGVKGYVRYMDDMVLWDNDKETLKKAHIAIKSEIENVLGCQLKPVLLNSSSKGLPFLGYLLFPHHIRLSQNSKKRFARKMREIEEKYQSGEWSEKKCQRHALPTLAFTFHADAKGFRKKCFIFDEQ